MENVYAAGRERRRHPRTYLHMPIHCIRLDPGGTDMLDRLEMFDISRGGIGAVSQQRYYPGQRAIVRLPLSRASGNRHMYARVVRCRPSRQEGYEVGLEFEAAVRGDEADYRLMAA